MRKGTAVALLALLGAEGAVGQTRPAAAPVPPPAPGAVIVLDTPAPRRFTGEIISLDLKDADIRDVLKVFAKIGRFNLAIDPEVKGSVTVRLQNVPWDQALDVILRMNGLGYTLEGRILRTGTPRRLADP
jgi:type IV pilus assembly protein PilQ